MIIRTEKNQHYTTLANYALNDPQLSLKAKGLWAFIMSKPDDWAINYRGLMKQLKEGQRAILAALKELEDCNYLVRGKVVSKDGKFSQADATLFERPCVQKPCVQNVRVDNVRTKLNTKELSTDKDFDTKVSKGVPPVEKLNLQVQELFNFWAECTNQRIQTNVGKNRQACYRLYRAVGLEEAKRLIQSAAKAQSQQYAPVVGDFVSLDLRRADLLIWEKRNSPAPVKSVDIQRLLYPERFVRERNHA